jgi:hypothetical protein
MQMHNLRFATLLTMVSTLLAFASASFAVAGEDASKQLVGSWYGERIHSGQIQGKPFNRRRWFTTHRSDGTGRDVYRYYQDDKMQAESIEDYRWGVQDDIYWNVCQSTGFTGSAMPCSERSEYIIRSVTSREFRYCSKKSKIEYSMVRVPEDFRLP